MSFICNFYSRLCLWSNRCFKGKSEKQKKVRVRHKVLCVDRRFPDSEVLLIHKNRFSWNVDTASFWSLN